MGLSYFKIVMRYLFSVLIYFAVLIALPVLIQGQNLKQNNSQELENQDSLGDIQRIINIVQRGINTGEVDLFSDFIAPKVYLSIPSNEQTYYSANQAYYILEKYFDTHKLQNFIFNNRGGSNGATFASGKGTAIIQDKLLRVQIYIALSKIKDRWMITQFHVF